MRPKESSVLNQQEAQYKSRDGEHKREENRTSYFYVPIHVDYENVLKWHDNKKKISHLTKKHYIRIIRFLHVNRHAYL